MHIYIIIRHKKMEKKMRTTLEIDADLLKKIIKNTGVKTKKKAVEIAMKEFLRAKRREELSQLIGNYEDFSLSLEELERMRSES
jgi:Arc/MetJ family transcription regulator